VTPTGKLTIMRWIAFQFDATGIAGSLQRHKLALDPAVVDGIVSLGHAGLADHRPALVEDVVLGLFLGGKAQAIAHPLVAVLGEYFRSPAHWSDSFACWATQ
jgi:hypothetical protein